MSLIWIPLLITALLAFGMSIYGLFNRKRSILCAIAGVLLALTATPGALHAWGESRSVPWTGAYLAIMLIGIIAVARQLLKNNQATDTSAPCEQTDNLHTSH